MQVNDLRRPDVAGHALGWSLPGHLKGLRKSSAKPLLTCTDARQGGLAVAPGTSLGHATPCSFIDNGFHQGPGDTAAGQREEAEAPSASPEDPQALRPARAAWSPNPRGRNPAAGPQHGAGDAHVILHRAGRLSDHSDDKGEEGAVPGTTSRYPRASRWTSVSVAASTTTRVRVGSSTAKARSEVSWWNQSVNAMKRNHR